MIYQGNLKLKPKHQVSMRAPIASSYCKLIRSDLFCKLVRLRDWRCIVDSLVVHRGDSHESPRDGHLLQKFRVLALG